MKAATQFVAICMTAAVMFAGCGGSDTSWVYEHEGERMSAGVYITYQMQTVDDALSRMHDEYHETNGTEHTPYEDFSYPEDLKDSANEIVDGIILNDWVAQKTAQYAKSYFVVQREAARLGIALSETDLTSLRTNVQSAWDSYSEELEKNGVSQASWLLYQQNEILKSRLFDSLYGDSGERAVPDDEVKSIFSQDYVKADVLIIEKAIVDPEDEAFGVVNQLRKDMAEGYLARVKEGETIEAVEYDYRLQQTSDENQSTITMKTPGELSNIFYREDDLYYKIGLVEAVFDSKVGEAVLVETDNDFFLIIRKDILTDDPTDFESYRATIVATVKFDEFEQWLHSEADNISVNVNGAALTRYKMTNLQR